MSLNLALVGGITKYEMRSKRWKTLHAFDFVPLTFYFKFNSRSILGAWTGKGGWGKT
jgi:hypothetical protein